MRIGVLIEETWSFFHEVYAEFQQHFETSLFDRRNVNWPIFNERATRHYFHHDLESFLRSNDVVFFEWASELLAYASKLPKTCGIVARLHRYEMYNWIDKINWDAVDRLILVTEAKKQEFLSVYPAQQAKLIVIPEAVNLSRFQLRDKDFAGDLGILCNLSPRKRVYELILAFDELVKVNDRFTLHIGGDRHPRFGDYFQAILRLIELRGLKDKVILYGNISKPEDWYSQIDIFISNSYNEGLQVSPLEAIASGCFALSHNWSGADEFFPAENLYFTDQELIDKILHFSQSNPAIQQAMKEQLRQILRERFDIDKTKVQICKVVEEVATLTQQKSLTR